MPKYFEQDCSINREILFITIFLEGCFQLRFLFIYLFIYLIYLFISFFMYLVLKFFWKKK